MPSHAFFPYRSPHCRDGLVPLAHQNKNQRKPKNLSKKSSSASSEEAVAALKQRVKELEKELSAAQLEAKAFKTLVEVAESLGCL